jgi:hypothetical protein
MAVGLASALALAAPAAAAPPRPFGHDCRPENGVLFCPTETLADRVASFDGAPLDVDVTLPLGTQRGEPLPTIVMMHGYGGSKEDFETTDPGGGDPTSDTLYHWNNNYFARRGYAVVNYSARGFGDSCGSESSASTPECQENRSYIHLADQRWEVHDTQYLLGVLADQEITRPRKVGVTGISYGGGQSVMLAMLRDRIRLRSGDFKRWTSPDGKRMEIAAAYPRWPWSDLVYSLEPNGRFVDFRPPRERDSRRPLGILKQSYVTGLYSLGKSTGTYCGDPPRPPCDDDSADVNRWFARVNEGEPPDAEARAIANEIFEYHQGFGVGGREPPPILLQSGWTDDLFPAPESIRLYKHLRTRFPGAPVSMQFGDLGHQRGANKANSDRAFNDDGSAFFDRHLRGRTGRPAPEPGEVTAFTQTCPVNAPADGPFEAGFYQGLARGAVRMLDSGGLVTAAGGNPATAAGFDPIAAGNDPCKQTGDEEAPGTVVVRGAEDGGFTLMGLPTVRAQIDTTGNFGQLNARLWDVSPGPEPRQRLISRGAYRLRNDQDGEVTFQLFGNGWCFEPGHTAKLELLGKDDPFLRASNPVPPSPFQSVSVSDVRVSLPTAEANPGSGCRTP